MSKFVRGVLATIMCGFFLGVVLVAILTMIAVVEQGAAHLLKLLLIPPMVLAAYWLYRVLEKDADGR